MATVLVIDDDRSILRMIQAAFEQDPLLVLTAQSADDGLKLLKQQRVDVVLLDVMLPQTNGLEVCRQINAHDPKLPVIFITAGGNSDTAIEAMKLGAHDYLLKPLNLDEVHQQVQQALEIRRLMQESVEFSDESPDTLSDESGDQMVGRSTAMQDVYKAIGRVAQQDVTVLIRGESGTGKELVARALYHHSGRSEKPFLAVNCAALPDQLLESELFGHEKGAFTGADRERIGKFEQCNGGTIFLDEVGDMAPLVQSKVLRLLQQQAFERVGGNKTIHTDVRIIAATNRDLEKMIDEGEYRGDLYYRLNGFTIELPPLREREEDLPLLMDYFFRRISKELRKKTQTISPEAMKMLLNYSWPGNIRELQSAVRHTLLIATGSVIIPEFLPENIQAEYQHRLKTGGPPTNEATTTQQRPASAAPAEASFSEVEETLLESAEAPAEETATPEKAHSDSDLASFVNERLSENSNNLYEETLQMMERYLLSRVLRLAAGNKTKAAEMLGITRGSLRFKIDSLGLSIDHIVKVDQDDE
ncbi:Acetoacetate metabolism regulatory protein AtoC [Planctomycetales bacterium 10988]|nr:Acetoacetate metabolism regulatory protein AtoC [Planctomycetales bacterium 10988]